MGQVRSSSLDLLQSALLRCLLSLKFSPNIGIAEGARHHQVHRLAQDAGKLLFQVEIGIYQDRGLQGLELHKQV